MNKRENIVSCIGVDWADEDHQICEYDVQSGGKQLLLAKTHRPEMDCLLDVFLSHSVS